jgi:hypothetical protein
VKARQTIEQAEWCFCAGEGGHNRPKIINTRATARIRIRNRKG